MGNVARVFWRDLKRLAKAPAAWLVVLFLAVLPSLYTWFNVAAFWNPYDNTGNLRVCVVNEDTGADSPELGSLNLGSQIVEKLSGNDQLGWEFTTREEAEQAVRSGAAYAAFVIPTDFSSNVTTILSGNFQQPQIEYYVNEKTGPVSPKITDTGANELDSTINDEFVSAVSATLVSSLESKLDSARANAESTKEVASSRISSVQKSVKDIRGTISSLSKAATDDIKNIQPAKDALEGVKTSIADVEKGLSQTASITASANTSLVSFTLSMSTVLAEASQKLSQTSSNTNVAIGRQAAGITAAKGAVDSAVAHGQAATQNADQLVSTLRELADLLPDGAAKNELERTVGLVDDANNKAKVTLNNLSVLSEDAATAARDTAAAATSVDNAVQTGVSQADGFRTTVADTTLPAMSDSLATSSSVLSTLSTSVGEQALLIDETALALDQLKTTLETTSEALGKTDAMLAKLETNLSTLAGDIAALGTTSALRERLGLDNLDADAVADFMMSPTQVKTEDLYPLNAYGSAMAPLFINLTLWIGVFMLMVIMRLEVDDEDVKNLSIAQRFFARVLFLAPLAAAQAAICCAGCLVLGVQTASAPLFFATAIMASLAYLAIQYTLSSTLQHVGKALCIVLVFVQIPAATGLYPIEMTPDFFQAVYPLFPFTYGINAMRETIGGFSGNLWLNNMVALAGFLVAFLLVGSLAKPYLTNLNRMFAREIEESDIVIGETVELPARRYRTTQIIRALSNRKEYRAELESRVSRFMQLYPKLKRGARAIGIAVPIVATIAMAFNGVDKVIILTSWLVWLLLVIAFFVAVEYVRDRLSHEISLEHMSDDEVRTLYASRNAFTRVQSLSSDAAQGKLASQDTVAFAPVPDLSSSSFAQQRDPWGYTNYPTGSYPPGQAEGFNADWETNGFDGGDAR